MRVTEVVSVDVWRSNFSGERFVSLDVDGAIEALTPDQARAVAAALIEAADRPSELTPSEAPTGTGGADNESEAL